MTRRGKVQARRGRLTLFGGAVWTGVALAGVLAIGATAAAPTNDNFATPIVLTGAVASSLGDTNVDATLEPGEDTTVAGKTAGTSVWYRWTAPGNGLVVIDTATSGFDTLLGVYTGSTVNALTVVASNDDVKNTVFTSRVRFPATSGRVYQIRVDGFLGDSGAINLHVHQAPPPPNDVFANAIEVFQDVDVSGTNDGATLEAGEDSDVAGFPGGASVWYRWTAPHSGKFVIDTASSTFDTLLGIYTGGAVGSLTEVASNDDTKTLTSQVRFTATGGVVYRIRVDGFAEASGTVALHVHETLPVASPSNDNVANAISPPAGLTTSATGTTAGATLETNEPLLVAFEPAGASVWYSWSAPATGAVRIDTATSGFDTLVGVYTGTSISDLADVASNDDVSNTDLTSSVTFHATASTAYLIRVDGYAGDAGAFALHLNEVPDPPTSVSATAGNGQATVTWNIPANDGGSPITGYDVTRYVAGVAQGTTSVGVVTQTTVTGLTNGTTYTFRVAAKNATGTGAQSGFSNAVTPRTVPDAPTSVTATAGNGQATLSWTPTFNGGSAITGYDVTPYVAGVAQSTTTVGAVTETTVSGLMNGTTYTFRVAATNVAGTGAQSTDSNAVTPRPVPDAPTDVAATAGAAQATLSWTAPAFDGGTPIIGYDVTPYVAGVAQSTTTVGAVTQTTVSGLTNGTTYTFRVAAKNVIGAGAQSTDSNAVTPRTVPDAPTNVAATAGAGQATLSWTAPAFNGGSAITGYDVTPYVAGVAQSTTTVGAVAQTTVSGLTNGTTYTFRVAAKNVAGTGVQSSDSNAVTPRTAPDAPSSVSATAGAGQATVSWVAPASDGGSAVTGYVVTRYVGGLAYGTNSVGVVTQTTVSGLTNGTTYTFRVAAKNAIGTGAKSADSNAVTLDASRLTLTITKSGAGAGTVTSSVGAISCGASCAADFDQGASVMLTASASSGSTFAGWSGACAGMSSCIVTIDAAKTATARFDHVGLEQQQQGQPGSKCVVPNVKRKPLATAKRRIAAAHCRTGTVTKAKSKTVPKGRVISQRPLAGKKLAAGSRVKLVVSRGKR